MAEQFQLCPALYGPVQLTVTLGYGGRVVVVVGAGLDVEIGADVAVGWGLVVEDAGTGAVVVVGGVVVLVDVVAKCAVEGSGDVHATALRPSATTRRSRAFAFAPVGPVESPSERVTAKAEVFCR